MTGLDLFGSLIELLKDSVNFFLPWTILQYYERGTLLRLGRPRMRKTPGWWWIRHPILRWKLRHGEAKEDTVVGPGLIWHWPFRIDEVKLTTNIVFETQALDDIQLETQDGVAIDVVPVIGYSVSDVRKFLLEVENATDAVSDALGGAIFEAVRQRTIADIRSDPNFTRKVLTAVRKRASERFGIEVESLYFHALIPMGLKTGVIKVAK
jgi:regulator of protease activity HflC (stomatin/prohibitin superfamily)